MDAAKIVYVHGEKEVFKMQLPLNKADLSRADTDAPILVYNQSRFLMRQYPQTPELLKWFTEGRLKVYVRGLMGDPDMVIDEEVPNPGW